MGPSALYSVRIVPNSVSKFKRLTQAATTREATEQLGWIFEKTWETEDCRPRTPQFARGPIRPRRGSAAF